MLVDQNARYKKRKPKFELETFYGRLTHIYHVHFADACPAVEIEAGTTFIFAAVRACKLDTDDPDLAAAGLDIHFYSATGTLDVVDITSVQSLVGRVKMSKKDQWAIIDRSGALARAQWLGEE